MSLAETARLAVELTLQGNLGPGLAVANAELNKLEGTTARATARGTTGFVRLGKAVEGGKGALQHFQGQLGSLAGAAGLVGATTAALGFAGALEHGIARATDLSRTSARLAAVTGESATSMSELTVVMEKFGITSDKAIVIAGFLEKTMGKLSQTTSKHGVATSKALELQQKFGVQLLDSHKRALPFSVILGHVADYYNSNAQASNKAYLAATLFGRGYTTLIPILKLGSKGIHDAEVAARDLGVTLNATNVKDLAEFRAATREAGEAIGGLELQIGLAAVPAIKDLANAISSYLAHGGRDQLVGFFKTGIKFAQEFAGFVSGTVIPTVSSLAGMAKSFWNSIPAPLRDMIAKGFVADRVIKFLFGFSPGKLVLDFAGGALAKGLGSLLGGFTERGASALNPVYVADVTGGGPNGPTDTGGKRNLLKSVLDATVILAIGVAIGDAVVEYFGGKTSDTGGRGRDIGNGIIFGASDPARVRGQRVTGAGKAADDISRFANAGYHAGKALDDLSWAAKSATRGFHGLFFGLAHMSLKDVLAGIQKRSAEKFGGTGLGPDAVTATFQRDLLRNAARIAKSGETGADKLRDLKALQALAISHKDYGVAQKISARIDAEKARLAAAAAATTQAVRDKRTVFNTKVDVNTSVSVRDTLRAITSTARYSSMVSSSAGPGK